MWSLLRKSRLLITLLLLSLILTACGKKKEESYTIPENFEAETIEEIKWVVSNLIFSYKEGEQAQQALYGSELPFVELMREINLEMVDVDDEVSPEEIDVTEYMDEQEIEDEGVELPIEFSDEEKSTAQYVNDTIHICDTYLSKDIEDEFMYNILFENNDPETLIKERFKHIGEIIGIDLDVRVRVDKIIIDDGGVL